MIGYAYYLVTKTCSVIDLFWVVNQFLVATIYFYNFSGTVNWRNYVQFLLIALWSAR